MMAIFSRIMKLAGGLLASWLLLMGAARATAPTGQQVTFLSSSPYQSGFFTLDIERGLFAPYARQPIARTFSDFDWSPDREWIVYRSVRNISVDLFLVDMGGHEPIRLTSSGKNNHAPTWSPDGRYIAFSSERDGNPEIYVADADCYQQVEGCEGGLQRLTDTPTADDFPAWSPDSQQIAFQSNRDGNYEIYAINVDGANLRRLTQSEGRDLFPAWSPDGQIIAFASERERNAELYLMQADGGQQRRLTISPQHEFSPLWSPDGRQLLFERTVAGGDLETFLMDMGSGHIEQLTRASMFLHNPAWLTALPGNLSSSVFISASQ